LRVALAQINATVGDIEGNLKKMLTFYQQAQKLKVDLLIFPEMAICGYPPEDLLLKKHFLTDNRKAIDQLADKCNKMTVIAGFAEPDNPKPYNALAVVADGKVKKIYRKGLLPNYDVFDEIRYFQPGTEPLVIDISKERILL